MQVMVEYINVFREESQQSHDYLHVVNLVLEYQIVSYVEIVIQINPN